MPPPPPWPSWLPSRQLTWDTPDAASASSSRAAPSSRFPSQQMGIPSCSCLGQKPCSHPPLSSLPVPSPWLCLRNLPRPQVSLGTSSTAARGSRDSLLGAARGVPRTLEVRSSCPCATSQCPQSKPEVRSRPSLDFPRTLQGSPLPVPPRSASPHVAHSDMY